jgi:hypothetical protein
MDDASWSDQLERTLACYEEPLLRQVAGRLVKPRNQWPTEDLIRRGLDAIDNPAVLDRRLQDLEPAGRQVLALIGHSRQPCWSLGNLVEFVLALGHPDGLQPVFALLEAGLLYPVLRSPADRVKTFEQWLAFPGSTGLQVFTHPQIAARAVGEDFGLPDLSFKDEGGRMKDEKEQGGPSGSSFILHPSSFQEADGLEWPLRLAVLWQQVAGSPLRLTQGGGFFKRDHERLAQDAVLSAPPAEHLHDVPDLPFLTCALAEGAGLLEAADGELRPGPLPAAWEKGLGPTLETLWAQLPRVEAWDPRDGFRGEPFPGNPFPSAYLLAFLLLARAPADAWLRPAVLETWIVEHHPYWNGESLRPSRERLWLDTFLLGVAYHLRLVQAARDEASEWVVRLSAAGRWLLGLADTPPAEHAFPQTLMVQPNLEIVAYRQGLTPGLILRLTRFAAWKTLGAACTLQLEPETVYRALESGQTYETIRLTLEQHGTRAVPPAVLDSLRTWSNKRDRITVYPSATLLEFAGPEDLQEALSRGLPAVRVSDTLAVVADEDAIDFRHFRLTGTRDYGLPPERCVTVESDGVTLNVDPSRSDLLLETELPRFAERLDERRGAAPAGTTGRRQYRLTPASLARARGQGMTLPTLESWFQQRAGQPLSSAARLLLTGEQEPPVHFKRHLILHVATPEVADGLMQWPPTRGLIETRLGPTALAVAEEQAESLREHLQRLGVKLAE